MYVNNLEDFLPSSILATFPADLKTFRLNHLRHCIWKAQTIKSSLWGFIYFPLSSIPKVIDFWHTFCYLMLSLSNLKKKFEPEPEFEPQTSRSLAWRSINWSLLVQLLVRIPVQIKIFLLKSGIVHFPRYKNSLFSLNNLILKHFVYFNT